MQSINMFSTYGKLQLNFFTLPTSKNTESVQSLIGTCWEPVGNWLAGSFSIVTGLVVCVNSLGGQSGQFLSYYARKVDISLEANGCQIFGYGPIKR
jgi:hypothetical protein